MPTGLVRFTVVLLACATICFAATYDHAFTSGNEPSRFAQMEALVDYGSKTIEQSRYHNTPDRVVAGTREYSNKPPLLSLVGAAAYSVLNKVTGWRIAKYRGSRV